MTKKYINEQTKKKMSLSHKNQIPWNKGKTNVYSKETLEKMSAALKGKIFTNNHKRNLSKSLTEHPHDPWNKGKTNIYSEETKKKMRDSKRGKKHTNESKIKISTRKKYTIKKIQIKHPFFSTIEEMRYNPDKPEEKEIQVHCKNHNCINSKEKGGWFTPSSNKITRRIFTLEHEKGFGESNFYCSDYCKQECPLYGLHPFQYKIYKQYTQEEYQTFRQFVLNRDNYICQFCGKKATDVHHERPQKLEPFFALDPDYAWSCCQQCHYKFGHKDECNTGNLASKIC